jgi:hypothetical protein
MQHTWMRLVIHSKFWSENLMGRQQWHRWDNNIVINLIAIGSKDVGLDSFDSE